jgi:hypothetical protein
MSVTGLGKLLAAIKLPKGSIKRAVSPNILTTDPRKPSDISASIANLQGGDLVQLIEEVLSLPAAKEFDPGAAIKTRKKRVPSVAEKRAFADKAWARSSRTKRNRSDKIGNAINDVERGLMWAQNAPPHLEKSARDKFRQKYFEVRQAERVAGKPYNPVIESFNFAKDDAGPVEAYTGPLEALGKYYIKGSPDNLSFAKKIKGLEKIAEGPIGDMSLAELRQSPAGAALVELLEYSNTNNRGAIAQRTKVQQPGGGWKTATAYKARDPKASPLTPGLNDKMTLREAFKTNRATGMEKEGKGDADAAYRIAKETAFLDSFTDPEKKGKAKDALVRRRLQDYEGDELETTRQLKAMMPPKVLPHPDPALRAQGRVVTQENPPATLGVYGQQIKESRYRGLTRKPRDTESGLDAEGLTEFLMKEANADYTKARLESSGELDRLMGGVPSLNPVKRTVMGGVPREKAAKLAALPEARTPEVTRLENQIHRLRAEAVRAEQGDTRLPAGLTVQQLRALADQKEQQLLSLTGGQTPVSGSRLKELEAALWALNNPLRKD